MVSDSFVTLLTAAHQAPLSIGLSWQEYWLPFSSLSKEMYVISKEQTSLETLVNLLAIHYEDFSFLIWGESSSLFEVATPFSIPFLQNLPLIRFFFTLGA